MNDIAKKRSPVLLIALIAGGVIIVAAAVVLIVLLTGGSPLTGPWHNETLNQLLRFHDDQTVVIHTQSGVSEGSYVFDAKNGTGIITKDGQSLTFMLSGDTLLVYDGGAENEFFRGDMEIVPAFAEATPSATPAATPPESPSVPPAMTPTAAPPTEPPAEPSSTPKPPASPSPTSTITLAPPAVSAPTPTPSGIVVSQGPLQPSSVPSLVLTVSVVGTWNRVGNPGEKLEFRDDGTVRHTIPPSSVFGGEYEYDEMAREGTLYIAEREIKFNVTSANKLTLEDGRYSIAHDSEEQPFKLSSSG